jgi:hypothetical protein
MLAAIGASKLGPAPGQARGSHGPARAKDAFAGLLKKLHQAQVAGAVQKARESTRPSSSGQGMATAGRSAALLNLRAGRRLPLLPCFPPVAVRGF